MKHWKAEVAAGSQSTVLPDGCRDLIIKHGAGVAPVWFITDISKSSEQVCSARGDRYNGFRMHPGAQIEQAGLMASLEDGLSDAAITERVQNHVVENPAVTEALACLTSAKAGVVQAAADLGVHPRSLQRLLMQKTGKSPAFWLRLARVRKTAIRLPQTEALADLAYEAGYADQAHMTREFRQWLGITPHQVRRDTGWVSQHMGLGYAA